MADRTLKAYHGEDLTPVYDLTELNIWERSEFGMRAWQGESINSNVTLRDEQCAADGYENGGEGDLHVFRLCTPVRTSGRDGSLSCDREYGQEGQHYRERHEILGAVQLKVVQLHRDREHRTQVGVCEGEDQVSGRQVLEGHLLCVLHADEPHSPIGRSRTVSSHHRSLLTDALPRRAVDRLPHHWPPSSQLARAGSRPAPAGP